MSITDKSAWRERVSSPARSALPKTAPATRKHAAELQSPSISIDDALYDCRPFICKTISVQSFQSCDSANSGPPSISQRTFTPNAFITSIVINRYGMLFGLRILTVESSSSRGNAISSPEIICEPPEPETVTFPPISFPETFSGTKTSSAFRCTASSCGRFSRLTPNDAIISRAPFSGLRVNVPSPAISVSPPPRAATRGIISLVSRPDSPVSSLVNANPPAFAPIPLIVNADVSLVT